MDTFPAETAVALENDIARMFSRGNRQIAARSVNTV